MVRNFRRSGQEPDLSLMSQGENAAYLVLRGVFHVSPPALGGLSIDGKLTFSNNAYLKLTTEWTSRSQSGTRYSTPKSSRAIDRVGAVGGRSRCSRP